MKEDSREYSTNFLWIALVMIVIFFLFVFFLVSYDTRSSIGDITESRSEVFENAEVEDPRIELP
jgi:heme/copper-type cytochrome/quinol oxidase subunit 2